MKSTLSMLRKRLSIPQAIGAAFALLALPAVCHADTGWNPGGDTHHDRHHWFDGDHEGRRHPREWCGEMAAMISSALAEAHETDGRSEKRASLAASVQHMIDAYDGGGLPFQPLTYSVLQMASRLNAEFPAPDERGDASGGIVLDRFLATARTINEQFDVGEFVPVAESFRQCHHFQCHEGRDSDDLASEFYTHYLDAAKAAVNTLFAQAVPGIEADLLEAMGEDRWELDAAIDVLDFVGASLQKDLYGRYFGCLKTHVRSIRFDLAAYLASTPVSPHRDEGKRNQIEDTFAYLQDELNGITLDQGGHWRCGH